MLRWGVGELLALCVAKCQGQILSTLEYLSLEYSIQCTKPEEGLLCADGHIYGVPKSVAIGAIIWPIC